MQDFDRQISMLADWYQRHAQPFLQRVCPERVVELDKGLAALQALQGFMSSELAICFLGNSGVGKSTLVNALIDGETTVVPSGGIGPLTAQALTVKYSRQPYFTVNYHPLQKVWRLIFALEQMGKSELKPVIAGTDQTEKAPEIETLYPEGMNEDLDDQPPDDEMAHAKFKDYKHSAQLIITGRQDNHTDLAYLVDSLREAIGKPRVWATLLKDEDSHRVARVRDVLGLAKENKPYVRHGVSQDRGFLDDLRDHASGFLAPLIKELTVYWDCNMLDGGISLVDLPGVGIAGDVHREVTRKWIREKAQAVVLVVDHRGITESVAELLRKSEFLNRLMFSADEPQNDPILMVVMVKIDDAAEERYRENRNRGKRDHFADVCTKAHATIREQIRTQLETVWPPTGDGASARQQVINNIIASMQIHPLSAIQYRKLLVYDEDDRPFIKDPSESNVPQFMASLYNLAKEKKQERFHKLQETFEIYRDQIFSILNVIQAQWQEQTRASEEAERLREDLSIFMEPLRKEFHLRQGQYRAFLKKLIPQRISDLVKIASGQSQKAISSYLNRLGYSHWATLRASVRRGGRFLGATDIDLPREFALRFEEPIAEAWGKQILIDIRRETKEYADDCVRLVEQVVDWARDQKARVKAQQIEAQYGAIKADAKKSQAVGREMVNELREEAKNQLINTIEGPIRAGCRKFVDRHADVGPGVKARILELFAELAEQVTDDAVVPATEILRKLFRDVEKEILTAFAAHSNPLDTASEAIVSSHENYLKRSDSQRRKSILDELTNVMSEGKLLKSHAAATGLEEACR